MGPRSSPCAPSPRSRPVRDRLAGDGVVARVDHALVPDDVPTAVGDVAAREIGARDAVVARAAEQHVPAWTARELVVATEPEHVSARAGCG